MSDPAASSGRITALVRRLRLVDTKFGRNKATYLIQSLLMTVTILVVLLALDAVSQTVLIASLGASAFIAFALPQRYASKPRYLVGGYVVGTLSGCGLSLVATLLVLEGGVDIRTASLVCGALATGLAFLVMTTTDTEHPPAAALALGYVLNSWDGTTIMVVLAGIVSLSAIKELLRPRLMDLV